MSLSGGDRGGHGAVEVDSHQRQVGAIEAVVAVARAELPPCVPPPAASVGRPVEAPMKESGSERGRGRERSGGGEGEGTGGQGVRGEKQT